MVIAVKILNLTKKFTCNNGYGFEWILFKVGHLENWKYKSDEM
jgi:hypothetical protein